MTTATTDNTTKINALLSQLATETVQANKKKIRRALRALGHRGGLRQKIAAAVADLVNPEPEITLEPESGPENVKALFQRNKAKKAKK